MNQSIHSERQTNGLSGAATSVGMARPWIIRGALYLVVFILASVVSLYIRFPEETVSQMVNDTLQAAPVPVSANNSTLSFPPGLRLSGVSISSSEAPEEALLTSPVIDIKPSLVGLLFGEMKGSANAKLLGGVVSLNGATSDYEEVAISFSLENLNIGQGLWWGAFPWFKAEGSINGNGDFDFAPSKIYSGAGEAAIDFSKGSVLLSRKLSPDGRAIKIDSGSLKLKMEKGMATITEGSFSGPEMNLDISGNAVLSPVLRYSRINITLALRLDEKLKESLGTVAYFLPPAGQDGKHIIRIAGTLARPAITQKESRPKTPMGIRGGAIRPPMQDSGFSSGTVTERDRGIVEEPRRQVPAETRGVVRRPPVRDSGYPAGSAVDMGGGDVLDLDKGGTTGMDNADFMDAGEGDVLDMGGGDVVDMDDYSFMPPPDQ